MFASRVSASGGTRILCSWPFGGEPAISARDVLRSLGAKPVGTLAVAISGTSRWLTWRIAVNLRVVPNPNRVPQAVHQTRRFWDPDIVTYYPGSYDDHAIDGPGKVGCVE